MRSPRESGLGGDIYIEIKSGLNINSRLGFKRMISDCKEEKILLEFETSQTSYLVTENYRYIQISLVLNYIEKIFAVIV